jgi:hypothetical protein
MSDGSNDRSPKEPKPPSRGEAPIAEIRFSDFVAAKRDPSVAKFLEEAKKENATLARRGLIHPA